MPLRTDNRLDLAAFQEIIGLYNDLPKGSLGHAQKITSQLAVQQPEWGHMIDHAALFGCFQHTCHPHAAHPRLAILAASYGPAIAEQSDLYSGLQASLNGLQAPSHPINTLASLVDCDVRLYDLNSANIPPAIQTSLSEQEAAHAMAYGMMMLESGVDTLILASAYPAMSEQACQKLLAQLTAERESNSTTHPFDALCRHAGADIAAMVGAILAARMAQCPVILTDTASLAAAMILDHCAKGLIDHCLVAQTGLPTQIALLHAIKRPALLNMGAAHGAIAGLNALLILRPLLAQLSSDEDTDNDNHTHAA